MAAALEPETILKEMGRLWGSLGEKAAGEGVLRACSMTLIAVTPEAADMTAVSEAIAETMRDYPSRAIVLRLHEEPRAPEAHVVAQCWMPFGKREQICCEQVEIVAALGDLPALKPFLLALIAPDLPVAMWVRGPLDVDCDALQEITPLAGKLIVESAAWPDTSATLARLAAAAGRQVRIGDLSWTRLTRWREMVAQTFENASCMARLRSFRSIEIEHGGDRVPPAALYLAAWLAHGLGWEANRREALRFRPNAGSPAGHVHSLRLIAEEFEAVIRRTEETVIELAAGALRSRGVLPLPTEAALLREELAITGRDRIFEEVLPLAAGLAPHF